MKRFLLFVFCTLYALAMQARQQDVSIVSRLNAQIRPIQTLRADSSFEDIAFLEEKLRNKDLIGLGEVTHGTAEVFRYKDRLVRFLVSRMGFRAIAFESDFIAMEVIDAYINGQTDSLSLLSGTALGGSNRPMINWLRAYNLEREAPNRVHVYGVELRELGNISRKLVLVIPGLSAADNQLLKSVASQPYNKLTGQDQEALGSLVARLNTSQLPELHRHYLDMLKQVLLYAKKKRPYRDAAMAQNVSWLKNRVKDGKVIVWAHNGHLARSELYGYPPMGARLAKQYGSKYAVIATDFDHGEAYVNIFIARNKPLLGFRPHYFPPAPEKAYEYSFAKCRYEHFILETATTDPVLADFLNTPRDMRMIGAWNIPAYKKPSIAANFDFIVYFRKTRSQW